MREAPTFQRGFWIPLIQSEVYYELCAQLGVQGVMDEAPVEAADRPEILPRHPKRSGRAQLRASGFGTLGSQFAFISSMHRPRVSVCEVLPSASRKSNRRPASLRGYRHDGRWARRN